MINAQSNRYCFKLSFSGYFFQIEYYLLVLLKNKNMSQIITCPSCKTLIDLEKINQDKYRNELEADFQKRLDEKTQEMRKQAQAFAEKKMAEQAKKDSLELEDMKKRLEEHAKKEDEFQKQELEMRKKQRELEDAVKSQELEMQRKLDTEKKKLEEHMSKIQAELLDTKMKELQEENRKKEQEMLKQQEQMKKTIDDLKRKAEQGSQQIQWDISEDNLRDSLRQSFPIDDISDVATGVKGADITQIVKNNIWQQVGIIIWESKNTKNFDNKWILKLKDDKLQKKWNIAILVTATLPKEIENFGLLDDVMICLPKYAVPVASILREKLIAVAKTEKSLEWKDIKMEMLYKYLSSEEFSSKIWMMLDVFSQLKNGIDSERRAMEKNWKKREKDLERATFAVTGIYGELESLMGQALPWSEVLELESWDK